MLYEFHEMPEVILPNFTRNASTCADFVGNNRVDEDKKIEEGIALLVRR